jgi:hypothetical protein
MSDARKADKTSAQEEKKPRPEVFDSSRYDSMSDMTGGSPDRLPDAQAMIDVQKKEPIRPEDVGNRSISSAGAPAAARVNPMVAEERARTIREINEEATPIPGSPEGQEVKVVEHYGTVPGWAEYASQYAEMVNAGMAFYAEFVKNATEIMDSWLRLWYPGSRRRS